MFVLLRKGGGAVPLLGEWGKAAHLNWDLGVFRFTKDSALFGVFFMALIHLDFLL